jgi:BRCT domain type II-containing protein
VSKDLSYLVTNDTESGSAKNKKAGEFGIPIIDEDAFLAIIKNIKEDRAKDAKSNETKKTIQGELF